MKRIVLLSSLVLAMLALSACDMGNSGASGGTKIGIVNLEKVFTESKVAKDGMDVLNKVQANFEPKLKDLQQKAKTKDANQQAASKEFGDLLNQYQTQMTGEQTRISNLINEGLNKVLSDIQKKDGYKLILSNDKALSFTEDMDITARVIKGLDDQKINVAPATVPAPETASSATATPAPETAPAPATESSAAPAPEAAPAPATQGSAQ